MAKTVVVYHSGYGHTQRVAEFVAKGAEAELIAIDADGNISDAQWETLDAADAVIFGSPTYMGMASWQFKKFADLTSKRWFSGAWRDKVAGGFTITRCGPSGTCSRTIPPHSSRIPASSCTRIPTTTCSMAPTRRS